jgi:TonB family protein
MPAVPLRALGGGVVIVELVVDDQGNTVRVRPLRTTAPYTELVIQAVKAWRFSPAQELLEPPARSPAEPLVRSIAANVLVAALFRPPAIYANTTSAEPARDVSGPSDDVPFPLTTATPALHPFARDPGVVLVEGRLNADGTVGDARVRSSRPPFDDAALDAARQWQFRPARVARGPNSSRIYLMFGFRTPEVTLGK